MIDIAVWRARIGLFNLSIGRILAGKRVKVRRPTADCSVLLGWITITPLEAATVLVLLLLVLCGDVDINPGPGDGKILFSVGIYIHCIKGNLVRRPGIHSRTQLPTCSYVSNTLSYLRNGFLAI